MNQSFDRSKRLLEAKQFKAVFDSPDYRLSGRCILLLVRHNPLEHSRLGLVVGKKNVRLAVARNQIKRQVREFFRLQQGEWPGIDMVVVARRGIADLSAAELRQELARQASRLQRKLCSAKDLSSVAQPGQADA